MKKYEYKHFRVDHGNLAEMTEKKYDELLEKALKEMGDQGWDLKGFQCQNPHTHLIFGREIS